jgi:hypothetical protein
MPEIGRFWRGVLAKCRLVRVAAIVGPSPLLRPLFRPKTAIADCAVAGGPHAVLGAP